MDAPLTLDKLEKVTWSSRQLVIEQAISRSRMWPPRALSIPITARSLWHGIIFNFTQCPEIEPWDTLNMLANDVTLEDCRAVLALAPYAQDKMPDIRARVRYADEKAALQAHLAAPDNPGPLPARI